MSLGKTFYQFLWRLPWLNISHKKSIYKTLCTYGIVHDYPFEKEFFGLKYQGNLNNSIEFSIFYLGAFEKPLLFFLRDTMEHIQRAQSGTTEYSGCFCDIGANLGQHSLFMSRFANQVYAFEPFSKVSQRLLHHINLNNIHNIRLHPVGLSDRSENLTFYAPIGRNQGIGSFDSSSLKIGNLASGKLPLVKGDDYFQEMEIANLDIVKIDVEGFEKKVLLGMQDVLKIERPIIVFEVSYGNELSFGSVQQLNEALPENYQLFTFNTRKPDGRKARKRGAKAKKTGTYQLIPLIDWRASGQDNIIACPEEKERILPMQSTGRITVP